MINIVYLNLHYLTTATMIFSQMAESIEQCMSIYNLKFIK
jgi:hypothetical protein